MSKKKLTRSPWYGTDDLDVYISQQKSPRFVIHKTGERSTVNGSLDEVREYVRKHKGALRAQYEFGTDGVMVPLDITAVLEEEEPDTETAIAPKTRVFKAKEAKPRLSPTNTITVIVNGVELTVPAGSKVEFK